MQSHDRVLVTGAGGFIGGHLVAEFRKLGYKQIRAVDPSFGQALCHMMDLSVETVCEAAEDLLANKDGTHA